MHQLEGNHLDASTVQCLAVLLIGVYQLVSGDAVSY